MPDNKLNFSSDFTAPDQAQWMSMVEATLKGKPFDKMMQTRTRDNIVIDALSTARSGKIEGQPSRAHGNWAIASPNWSADATTVNRDILIDLEHGASSIAITVDTHGDMGIEPEHLGLALDGVYLDMISVNLIQGEDFKAGVDAYHQLIGERGYKQGVLTGSLGVDPIGTLARSGRLQTSAEEALADGAEIAVRWSRKQPNITTFNADGTVVSNAGGTEATEIASAISAAVVYLRAMEQAGLSLDIAARQIQFTFSAGADLWLTIAKFRAARRVWQNVLTACGVEPIPMKLNAVSAVYAISVKDPWINILRGTAACFAAAIGGADTITTLPHDLFLGTTNDFSRRVARNIQIVLMEESSLARVSDPAAGSYSLEKVTGDMAHKSAGLFADMEAAGGIIAALRSGSLATAAEKAADQRNSSVRRRTISITGVSEFPNIQEPALVSHDETAANIQKDATIGEEVTPLPLRTIGRDFENLRSKSDAISLKTGTRPKIALVNLGAAADFTARAAFSKNFFEAGGIETIQDGGASTVEQAVSAYSSSGSSLAVICGMDEHYSELGVELAKALKQAGCSWLYLAGKPAGLDSLLAAGVDECIYAGCDVIDALERAYSAIEQGDGERML